MDSEWLGLAIEKEAHPSTHVTLESFEEETQLKRSNQS